MIHESIQLYPGQEEVSLVTYIQDSQRLVFDKDKKPAVIICPGGAYLYLSDREAEPVALAFAKMGYQAFILNYSVYGHAGEEMKENTSSKFPAPMQDIARAMEIICQNSEKWHIDDSGIGLIGFSAGGHNVASYGNMWRSEEINEGISMPVEKLKPAFNVLAYPVTNYWSLYESYLPLEHLSEDKQKTAYAFAMASFGRTEVNEALLKKWSPALTVNEDTPATFLWTTREDEVVPASQTLEMMAALDRGNIPYEGHIFSKGPHGLSLAQETTAVRSNQVNPEAGAWLPMLQSWLKKL